MSCTYVLTLLRLNKKCMVQYVLVVDLGEHDRRGCVIGGRKVESFGLLGRVGLWVLSGRLGIRNSAST